MGGDPAGHAVEVGLPASGGVAGAACSFSLVVGWVAVDVDGARGGSHAASATASATASLSLVRLTTWRMAAGDMSKRCPMVWAGDRSPIDDCTR